MNWKNVLLRITKKVFLGGWFFDIFAFLTYKTDFFVLQYFSIGVWLIKCQKLLENYSSNLEDLHQPSSRKTSAQFEMTFIQTSARLN